MASFSAAFNASHRASRLFGPEGGLPEHGDRLTAAFGGALRRRLWRVPLGPLNQGVKVIRWVDHHTASAGSLPPQGGVGGAQATAAPSP